MMKHSTKWRLLHLVHNCVAHPLLPAAEALDAFGVHRVANVIFAFHDVTTPDNDTYNRTKFNR
jgi:hypothetical protein